MFKLRAFRNLAFGIYGMSLRWLSCIVLAAAEWYDNIPSIRVFSPAERQEAQSVLASSSDTGGYNCADELFFLLFEASSFWRITELK